MSEIIDNKVYLSTAQGYDLWSKSYDHDLSHTVKAAREALLKLVPNLNGKHILEVGCGTGANLELLSDDPPTSAMGIDISEGMLNQARKKTFPFPTDFVCHDVNEGLPVPNSSKDLVVMSLVLEHLDVTDFIFEEVSRVLRPGGRSLMIELHPYRTFMDGFARFKEQPGGVEYRMNSRGFLLSELLTAHADNSLILDKALETFSDEENIPSVFATLSTLKVL